MSIPIRNIYYLLAYAWDRLEEADLVTVSDDDFKNIADLFGKVLATGVQRLIKRGLDRGYVECEQELSGVRGKLVFAKTLKSNLLSQGRTVCLVEELTADVLHNRIIRQTICELLQFSDLDKDVADELQECRIRMGDLTPVRLSRGLFSRIQLHGNNSFYRFLLEICRLVYESCAVDEATGTRRFRDFARDDGPMARLFEKFVRNFFRREQQGFRVNSRKFQWAETVGSDEDIARLPGMQTDIFLDSDERRIVIDTKFYRQPLQGNFGRDSVRSAHLYQLFAYLRNLAVAEPSHPLADGILLYPLSGDEISIDVAIQGHRVQVKTIDLTGRWQAVHQSLLGLIQP